MKALVVFLFIVAGSLGCASKPEQPKLGDCKFIEQVEEVVRNDHDRSKKIIHCYDDELDMWVRYKRLEPNRKPAGL